MDTVFLQPNIDHRYILIFTTTFDARMLHYDIGIIKKIDRDAKNIYVDPSRNLQHHIAAGQFYFHPKCHELGITHIHFANGLFILRNFDDQSFQIVHTAKCFA